MNITKADYTRAVNYARKRLMHRADSLQDARDVVQDAMIKLLDRDQDSNKFLFRYIQDCIHAHHVIKSAVKRAVTEDVLEVNYTDDFEEQAAINERHNIVLAFAQSEAAASLPVEQRLVLTLVATLADRVQTELVERLQCSKPLANYHYNQAFKHLTAYVQAKGIA